METVINNETLTNVDYMLTTIDNPYDPFEQFTEWFMFDVEKGYYSCSRLARFTNNSNELSQKEEEEDIKRAIDEVIKHDVLDIYKRAYRKNTNLTE